MGEVTREMAKHDVRIRRGNVNVHRDQGSLSDSTKLWVNASSLPNTVKRLTTKRERDQSNG